MGDFVCAIEHITSTFFQRAMRDRATEPNSRTPGIAGCPGSNEFRTRLIGGEEIFAAASDRRAKTSFLRPGNGQGRGCRKEVTRAQAARIYRPRCVTAAELAVVRPGWKRSLAGRRRLRLAAALPRLG